ncbi:MAG TPA: hypothetical protein VHN77_09000 [Phycisphaerales bacterium]|nr:hypothetical protein [Phycisphaerales bacterium]
MFASIAQNRPISRSTFSGLTLLLVVAMAYQVGGAALPGEAPGYAGHRAVQDLPAIAQAQIARRADRFEKRLPVTVSAIGRDATRRSPVRVLWLAAERPALRMQLSELDLPPPARG